MVSKQKKNLLHPWAPCPTAVSIRVDRPLNSSDVDVLLVAELRCGIDIIEDNNGRAYEYGFKKLYVDVDVEGCHIKMGPRLGDQAEQFKVKSKRTVSVAERNQSRRKMGLGIGTRGTGKINTFSSELSSEGKASIEMSQQADGDLSNSQKLDRFVEEIFHPIISNGLSGLIVSNPTEKPLQSAFLQKDDLCCVSPNTNSFYSVNVKVSFQAKDIVIESVASENSTLFSAQINKNKLAFAKLLISKYLKEMNPESINHSLAKVSIAEDSYCGPDAESSECH